MKDSEKLLLILDFLGTLVFAVEGGTAAMRANLDVLAIMVLSFTTALGGGTIRDVLIGCVPPGSIRDWRYGTITVVGLKRGWNATAVTTAGAVFCFLLRITAVWQHWNLPIIAPR